MDIPHISDLLLRPSASDQEILNVENEWNAKLPHSYIQLLKISNGILTEQGIVIYGTEDMIERNATWETKVYAQDYIAIGDDSGGRVFLMHQGDEEKRVLIVDSGDMTPEHADLVTSDFTQWVKNGFLIKTDETEDSGSTSLNCKIVLIDMPNGGLKDLLKIKSVFGLKMTAADLLKGSRNLPFIVAEEYPYGLAKKLVEKMVGIKIELRVAK
ncbi:SMI1/KNR4 family protein [Cytobacillus massiliigabonensis]|uniref:SMI1/KNR4 family protein n=1 Tax=Cytobacillus massiliigabonensis TaxID=1871011 RepID=UPI000C819016|nr:SMI1/KNR4 family protein [Cytobacillus massiliigabonensis]